MGRVWLSAWEAGTSSQCGKGDWEDVAFDQGEPSHPPTVPAGAIVDVNDLFLVVSVT